MGGHSLFCTASVLYEWMHTQGGVLWSVWCACRIFPHGGSVISYYKTGCVVLVLCLNTTLCGLWLPNSLLACWNSVKCRGLVVMRTDCRTMLYCAREVRVEGRLDLDLVFLIIKTFSKSVIRLVCYLQISNTLTHSFIQFSLKYNLAPGGCLSPCFAA